MKKQQFYCEISFHKKLPFIIFSLNIFLTVILHLCLKNFFLFPFIYFLYSIWIFTSLFYIDFFFYSCLDFPFLLVLLFPYSVFQFFLISFQFLFNSFFFIRSRSHFGFLPFFFFTDEIYVGPEMFLWHSQNI